MSTTPDLAATTRAKPDAWRVLELLRWTTEFFRGKGIESARLDAECLLAHALGVPRMQLYLDFEKPVSDEERAPFRELVRRRADERVPVALLTGEKEFWSLPLRVTADVLVPRPDTETLVEAALGFVPDAEAEFDVLDLGTGSGAIALALAKERPKARVTATDLSAPALDVARANALRLGLLDRVRLLEGDLFEPVAGERFDGICSNPPYVADAEPGLPPELAHEPRLALFGGADGTDVLRRIVDGAAAQLRPGGWLALELAPAQEPLLRECLERAGFEGIRSHLDIERRPRVLSARAGDQAYGCAPSARGGEGEDGCSR